MTKKEAILLDVPALKEERTRILAAIASLQNRLDRIEERFSDAGLDEQGDMR